MKKIILLLILAKSISATSQEPLFLFAQNPVETCDGSGTQSCLNLGVEGMNGSISIELFFVNINDQNDNYQFGVLPENESQVVPYCEGFTAGATYKVKAIDLFDQRESSTFQFTILGCSNIDVDADGFTADVDCNDHDPNIYPGATEVCDRKDNNCNGNVDEGFTQNTYYWDADQDGYGNPDLISVHCEATGRYVLQSGDCDDTDETIYPGATEICGDGVDNNCDGNIDEDCGCPDFDNDTVCDTDDLCPGANDLLDSDSDGTPDCLDNCPNDTNKTDPGICGCGIADTDTDNDDTPDCNDACPNDANKTEPGACGCGIADTDTDNDGTPDCNDACPSDPNKIAPGDCGCGAADTDTDTDGVLDCNDNEINSLCPNNVDANGVSIDSDNDGTPDCLDNCPNDRNKTEPGLCGCGTSDADKDGDGIPDCIDICPRGPDTDSDGDGVPDCIDICDGTDDTIDSDSDGLPDCVDTCPNDASNTCSGNTCRAGLFEICHVKKNGDITTLCVTPAQWERHKAHLGDALGACVPSAAKMKPSKMAVPNAKLNIYPNPIESDGLWIKFLAKENTEKFTATLYDLNGRILAKKVFESNYSNDRYFWEFNNALMDDGIFMLKIEDGSKTYFKRVLKL